MGFGGKFARYSDGLVIQQVTNFQNGSEFRVVASGI
jgi:hypothetical protein